MSASGWCTVCGTLHTRPGGCPGELNATEPERYGWRVEATSAGRTETFGVLIARAGECWRARILTLPNMIWSVPGGRCSMKFTARTATDAERAARSYIERIAASRGLQLTEAPVETHPDHVRAEGVGMDAGRATRMVTGLRILFGPDRATVEGRTSDLSASGMFVATTRTLPVGTRIKLLLEVESARIPLSGKVIWLRDRPDGGRPAGMGVELSSPPALYRHFTAKLRQRFLAPENEPVPVS